jgi:hypothetical protein
MISLHLAMRRIATRPPFASGAKWEQEMNLVTHKKFKGDRLMPWGTALAHPDLVIEIVAVAAVPD